jgi:hypothetical protein
VIETGEHLFADPKPLITPQPRRRGTFNLAFVVWSYAHDCIPLHARTRNERQKMQVDTERGNVA